MNKFNLDLLPIAQTVNKRIMVRGNEHKLTRVAFDMFRINDNPETLWKIQSDDDGNEFLVRTYTLPEEELSAQGDWAVISDKKKANLTISYKGVPIHRIIASEYGANTSDDSDLLANVLRQKLATDIDFSKKLLKSLPSTKLKAVANLFPELISTAGEEIGETSKDDYWKNYIKNKDSKTIRLEDVKIGQKFRIFNSLDETIYKAVENEEPFLEGTPEYVNIYSGKKLPYDSLNGYIKVVLLDDDDNDELTESFAEDIDQERQTRQTGEHIPISRFPEEEKPQELQTRQTRQTSEHIPISRFPQNVEEKVQNFVASPDFKLAFEKWLSENN